jgi:hypothetical protein
MLAVNGKEAMTAKEQASFIFANVDLIDTYDTRDCYKKAVMNRIKKEYNIYVEINEIDSMVSYHDNVGKILASKVEKFGDLETFRFYNRFKYQGSKIYLNINGDLVSRLGIKDIIYIMFYIVLDKQYDDYCETLPLQDKSGIEYDCKKFEYENKEVFGDVKVKQLINGKIIFKNLTDVMQERLDYLMKVCNNRW